MKAISWISVVAVALVIVGCQTMPYQPYARDVKRQPQKGGIVALHTEHRDEDRQKAMEMMRSNCAGSEVAVTEEGEVVTGQATTANTNENAYAGSKPTQVGSLFGLPVTSSNPATKNTQTSATTTNLKEWQIAYECKSAVAVAAPVAAPAAAATKPAAKKKQ